MEIYFRKQLAYELAKKTGLFGYEEPANLPRLSDERYEKFIVRCKDAFERSREPSVLHHKENYGDCHELPPYWMLVNVMDFGLMLILFKGVSGVLTILSYLLEYVAPDTSWRDRLRKLIGDQNEETLEKMGFKEGWRETAF